MDGTSLNNFIIEFERLYNGDNLKNIPIQYKDYAVWEEKYNESDEIKQTENYWINKFKDSEIPSLNLPYDYPNPTTPSFVGNRLIKNLDFVYKEKIVMKSLKETLDYINKYSEYRYNSKYCSK